MDRLQVHNQITDTWLVVDGGKVYHANTMIELPDTKGVLEYVKKCMDNLWAKMGEIDPIWGDLQLYHEYERKFLRYRRALYGH